jgi:hypothetical protein
MKPILTLILTGACVVWLPTSLAGAPLVLEPIQASVLPADTTGMAWAVFKFDLGALSSENGGQVNEATLLWPLESVSTDGVYDFSAYEVMVPWSSETLFSPQDSLSLGPEADFWLVDERANEGNEGVVARMGLKRIVEAWRTGNSANNGIAVATQSLSGQALAAELQAARLKIWCSCSFPDSTFSDSLAAPGN